MLNVNSPKNKFNSRLKSEQFSKRDWTRPEFLESGNNPDLKGPNLSYRLKINGNSENSYEKREDELWGQIKTLLQEKITQLEKEMETSYFS